MRYYKIVKDDETVQVACGTTVPEEAVEIGERTFSEELDAMAKADADRKAAEEAAAEKARKQAEKEAEEHQTQVDSYVEQVKAGTITLESVPEDYRSEVDAVVNPPKTTDERLNALEEQTATMQSAMDDMILSMAGVTAESEA